MICDENNRVMKFKYALIWLDIKLQLFLYNSNPDIKLCFFFLQRLISLNERILNGFSEFTL